MKNILIIKVMVTLFFWIATDTVSAQQSDSTSTPTSTPATTNTKPKAKEGINIHIPNPVTALKDSLIQELKSKRDSLKIVFEKKVEKVEVANNQKGHYIRLIEKQEDSLRNISNNKTKLEQIKIGKLTQVESIKTSAQKEGKKAAYGEILKNVFGGSIDEILAQQTESSILFYESYLEKSSLSKAEKDGYKAKIGEMKKYFSAKEALQKKLKNIPSLENNQQSKEVGNVANALGRYDELSKGLRTLLDEIAKISNDTYAITDEIKNDLKGQFSVKITSYLKENKLNSLEEFQRYGHLSEIVIGLIDRIDKDVNADISDLKNKL